FALPQTGAGQNAHGGKRVRMRGTQHAAADLQDLDKLDRDAASHRLLLLSEPNLSHTAFADLVEKAIAAKHRRQLHRNPWSWWIRGCFHRRRRRWWRRAGLQETCL